MNDWQLIETAPTDGTEVILALFIASKLQWISEAKYEKDFLGDEGFSNWVDSSRQNLDHPSHWTPMPKLSIKIDMLVETALSLGRLIETRRPSSIYTGKSYFDEINDSPQIKYAEDKSSGAVIWGMPVVLNNTIDRDRCDIFDQHGQLMAQFWLDGRVRRFP